MKNMNLLIATLTLSTLALEAQVPPPPGTVYQRRENQQDRIANGISNGQLTAGETSNLEHREANLNKQIFADRAANGGSLTNQEKNQINRRQNNLSNQIYADKHNNVRPQYGANQVDARRLNQQSRIAQGIRSGQMTAGEAARVEGHERSINQQVRSERAANGGALTAGQRVQANQRLNVASARIYNNKHNAATGPR